jgi:hypothetical protein
MNVEALHNKKARNKAIEMRQRQKRAKDDLRGLVSYHTEETHAFLCQMKKRFGVNSLSGTINITVRERLFVERLHQK